MYSPEVTFYTSRIWVVISGLKRLIVLASEYWRTRLTLVFLTHMGKAYYIMSFDKVPVLKEA